MAEVYESALRTLEDIGNPGRLFLTAHAIREMTTGLPKVLDLPVPAEKWGDQVRELEPAWNGALESSCHRGGQWSGQIDRPLQRLLRKLHGFFQWCQESRPRRRDHATAFFRRTDPAGLTLPEPLEKRRVKRWLELHKYFVAVAHRKSTTEAEFQARLDELEQILLDSLHRRPSEDLSAIDAILDEEAGDA